MGWEPNRWGEDCEVLDAAEMDIHKLTKEFNLQAVRPNRPIVIKNYAFKRTATPTTAATTRAADHGQLRAPTECSRTLVAESTNSMQLTACAPACLSMAVLISKGLADLGNMSKWQNVSYLEERFGETMHRVQFGRESVWLTD